MGTLDNIESLIKLKLREIRSIQSHALGQGRSRKLNQINIVVGRILKLVALIHPNVSRRVHHTTVLISRLVHRPKKTSKKRNRIAIRKKKSPFASSSELQGEVQTS